MPHILDGQPLTPGQPFAVADVHYPANVLDLWSEAELAEIGVSWVEPEPVQPNYSAQAQDALTRSDRTVLRCYEREMAVPEEWVTYREALRDIIRSGKGPVPARPDWPQDDSVVSVDGRIV